MIVCLDTNIVIYLIEANPLWTQKATDRFNALLAAGDQWTSPRLAGAELRV